MLQILVQQPYPGRAKLHLHAQDRRRREAVPAPRARRRMDDLRYPGAGFEFFQQGLGLLPWWLESPLSTEG